MVQVCWAMVTEVNVIRRYDAQEVVIAQVMLCKKESQKSSK
jgi:hypothetical protein